MFATSEFPAEIPRTQTRNYSYTQTLATITNIMDKELLSEIDKIIKECYEEGIVGVNYDSDINIKAFRIIKALNILKLKKSPSTYELSENSIIVIQDGGIKKYLENIRTEKNLDSTIKQLTSKRLKNDVWYNIMYVGLGGIIGIITSIGVELVKPKSVEEDIVKLHKSAFDKVVRDDNFQKRLNDMNTELLSLKNKLDSLKQKN
ncbi:hypothetical protein SAMN05444411_102592 [Lutibacter oricola]|uniref:Uncharacterized protein n=1 Tax=Lutibacter oricola TaxID=762486 RepID=A0A1H2Y0A1_9FLAO|nr:hypothetical protein [Lutibacter oricola]SDW98019.1 hypothetical protein SAMN05444411_102592 [Lutibacter oricola]